jgi:diaminopimelate decarboxylase
MEYSDFLKNLNLEYIKDTLCIRSQVSDSFLKCSQLKIETPCYLYNEEILRNQCKLYKDFLGQNSVICYALKANMNSSLLKIIQDEGIGADVTSRGELMMALSKNFNNIVYSGVGKSEQDIMFALENNIFQINVESVNELLLISNIAKKINKVANIGIRINPNIDAGTHNKISTGRDCDKFGIGISQLPQLLSKIKPLTNINFCSLAIHIGSQIKSLTPFRLAFEKLLEVYKFTKLMGFNITRVDCGGGLAIAYSNKDSTVNIKEYTELVNKILPNDVIKVFEPGRFLIGNAGIMLSKIIYIKNAEHKTFAILDAGMNDMLRVALYDAYHEIIPLKINKGQQLYDFVGPVCETSDKFASNRKVTTLHEGDIVAVLSTGAYGYSMASMYNGRSLPAEYIINRNFELNKIRKSISVEDFENLSR